jgi:CRP-like cAMP-binding protein
MSCQSVPVDHHFCGGCKVRRDGLCAALEPQRLIATLRPTRMVIPAGSDFPCDGSRDGTVFSIVDGWAVLHETLEDGRRQVVQVVLPGDTVCPPTDSATYMLTAVTQVLTCAVPFQRIEEAAVEEPALTRQLMALLRRERAQAFRHQSMLGRRTAKERVAFFLLETFIRFWRRPPAPGDTLKLPLTQFVMGDALGLTSIHVNRMLSELRKEGVVQVVHNEVTILDPDLLFTNAVADPATEFWMVGQEIRNPQAIAPVQDKRMANVPPVLRRVHPAVAGVAA